MKQIVVGNKYDMKKKRRVNSEKGIKLADKLRMKFMSTSVKTLFDVIEIL